jgi:tetratricopeptide (TPR) repeat protein
VLLTTCLSQQPKVVWIYLLRGFVQGQLGEYARAEADFQAALDLLAARPDAQAKYVLYNNRAVTRIGQKHFALAEEDLRKAIEAQPGQYQAYVTLAQVYQEQKKLKESIAELGRALEAAHRLVARKDAEARLLALLYRQRARAHMGGKDYDAALRDLGSALKFEEPGSASLARLQRERGRLLCRLDRHAEGLRAYDAAVAAQPRRAENWRWRGQVLLKLQRPDGAAEAFDRYFALGGKPTAQACRCRAVARLKRGDHKAALNDLTQALALGPEDVTLWVLRGQAYLACKAEELARHDFEEAIRRGPHSGVAHLARGLARLRSGRHIEAAEDAETAARLEPGNPRLLYDAACLMAQAAGQVQATGLSATRRERERRARYQDRSVALLRGSLLHLPAGQRARFWNDTVKSERSLAPVRDTAGYRQLEREQLRKGGG